MRASRRVQCAEGCCDTEWRKAEVLRGPQHGISAPQAALPGCRLDPRPWLRSPARQPSVTPRSGARAMATVERAAEPYQTIRLERRDGILPRTCQTNGGPLQWGEAPHREGPEAFRDIGSDPDTTVVIMTGTGAACSGPRATPDARRRRTAAAWDQTDWEGTHRRLNLLDIEVPRISAINGPTLRHSEIPRLCDIVLAAEETTCQDSAHVA
ncbi:MAG: hypothetical protein ACRERE_10890, partial [Candidatus Entotheonellia bacterium]